MRFKTDENLPVDVVHFLRSEGHDVHSVIDQQLAGHPDADVAKICQAESRVLITLDLDFSDIRLYPPEDYFGIIVLRPALQTISSILRLTARANGLLDSEAVTGRLWIVSEHQVRIRGAESSPDSAQERID
jgi:predicted nuclease of predicted toxin-antitoxin system